MKTNFNEIYLKQVELLLTLLPLVAEQKCFCLKGGTAINLFVLDMPRLSVDIDLVYLPINDRDIALNEIEQSLLAIKEGILGLCPLMNVLDVRTKTGSLKKLYVSYENAQVVIEPNAVLRGSLLPIEVKDLSKTAEKLMGMSVINVPVLNYSELYAGKICAALDRQHPRDLFDIKLLYENGGINNQLRQAFVVYLACSPRPMHELLKPTLLDVFPIYSEKFVGMTAQPVQYKELDDVRDRLIRDVNNALSNNERLFLLSIKAGEPEWDKLHFKGLERLPALQWKLFNIRRMDKIKHAQMLDKLKAALQL